MPRFYLCLVFIVWSWSSYGQSCCSGGVPLSNNLGMPGAEAGVLQFSLSYDYNNLNTLRAGWQRLSDNSRERNTHSALLNWSISLSKRFSLEGIFSYLQQERRIVQSVGTDVTRASGIGDAVFLLNYNIFSTPDLSTSWRAAIGVKTPLGAFDRRNNQDLILNAELQPGSGAWDIILWTQWSQSFTFRPSLGYNLTVAYSRKGENDAYLGSQLYRFGNEIQVSAGIADRLFLGSIIFDPGLTFRYRNAGADLFNNFDLPATGGEWIFMEPSIAYWLTPDLSFNFSASFPVMAFVQDTQFSPTIRTTVGFFHRLSLWGGNNFELKKF
ncbi:MAG: transporter [Bacteroidota bacterium]